MSEASVFHQRGMAFGYMHAGFTAADHALNSLGSALRSIETGHRCGASPNEGGIQVSEIENRLREMLARVEAVNAPLAIETRSAA